MPLKPPPRSCKLSRIGLRLGIQQMDTCIGEGDWRQSGQQVKDGGKTAALEVGDLMKDHFHRDPTYLFYFLLGCCLSNPTRKVCICRILPALKKAAYHHPVLKPRYPEWSDYCECHVFWSPDGRFHHQSI